MMKKTTIIALFIALIAGTSYAQPLNKASYATMIQTAEELVANADYYNALDWYQQAYDESEDREILPIIADLHTTLRDYPRAEKAYARLLRRDKENKYAELRFQYGRMLKMNGKYDDAIEEFEKYIAFTSDDIKKELAQNEMTGAEMAMVMGESSKVTLENIGNPINTRLSQYSPVVTSDGNTIFYSSFSEDQKEAIILDEKNTDYHVKVYTSTYDDTDWSKPTPLGEKINRPGYHTANVALSPNNKRLYFTRASLQGNTISESKIYMSTKGSDGWEGATELEGINGDYIATHPAVGELFSKEVLFFVSDMEGGYGGLDIYYATYKGEGVYADPVNLGPKINTVGDEVTPDFHDGTLYFSSTGHPGIGGMDIFYSVWDGATWSEPKNMGKGFNSSVDDMYFNMTESGYKGFITSNRPGGKSAHGKTCCEDIYDFEIAQVYADLVAGVFDNGKQPIKGATVSLIEMSNAATPISRENKSGNRFDFGLDLEKAYKVVATAPGYYPDSTTLTTVGVKEIKTFQHNFFLKAKPKPPVYDTLTTETPIVLENILYDFDSDKIKEQSEFDLQVVYELMTEYPDMVIELRSHTDNRGNDDYNENLSQRRAEAARRWLMKKGLPRERIQATGYGEKVPQTVSAKVAAQHSFLKEGDILTEEYIDALATEEQKEIAHQLNRRTEFQIIEGPTKIIIKSTRLRKQEAPKKTTPTKSTSTKKKQSSKSKRSRNRGTQVTPKATEKPRLEFSPRLIDLGQVKKGEVKTFEYTFTNPGKTVAKISLISSCDCTKTRASKEQLKLGETATLYVEFDSTEKEESETVDIDIFLDNPDPTSDELILEMVQYKFELIK